MKLPLLVTFFLNACNYAESARILAAIPMAMYSHQMFYQLLWRELAIRGHEVVVLTTHPTHENLSNFKEIDMSSTNTHIMKNGIADLVTLNDDKMAIFKRYQKLLLEIDDYELGLQEVQQLIKDEDEHFDLVMIGYLHVSFFAFKHRFNCPFIGVLSLDASTFAHDIMGNPTHPVLYPSLLLSGQVDLTFKQRLFSFTFNVFEKKKGAYAGRTIQKLIKKHFGDGYPDIFQITESVDLLFINNNPMFAKVRPLSPNTISIAGGIHMRAPSPLPEDLKIFLDGSTQGVIYFSMGSNMKSKDLSNATLHTIMKTFSQVPYNVLWKFESDDLSEKLTNVKIVHWAPQQDVLRHKNIKLFITQAGMQSLEEALFSHVPLIMLPVLGDQDGNADKVAQKQLGMKLNYRTLTVDEFTAAILEVITNLKYKNNIKKLAQQIQDQPMGPLERAVWWTEYVLRHNGAKHLKVSKIPMYQYYYLDILAFFAGCFLSTSVALYFMCKFVYKSVVRQYYRATIKIKQS